MSFESFKMPSPEEKILESEQENVNYGEKKENLSSIDEQLADADSALQKYAELTQEVKNTGRTSDIEYSQKLETAKKELGGFSVKITEGLGVNLQDMRLSEDVLLEKIVGIAKEARAVGFDKNLDDSGLIEEAGRLVKDYQQYVESVVQTGYSPDKNYSSRREAKQLLVESLAREIAKRFNLGDGIEVNSIKALREQTGVDFSQAVRKVERIYHIFGKEQEVGGRQPQIGASGVWETSGGYIDGKIVSGQSGGPYTIETSQGTIQVDKIL